MMSAAEFRQSLQDLNPEVDIDQLLEDQPQQSLAWYANYIVNNADTLPKYVRPRAQSVVPYHPDDNPNPNPAPVIDQFKLKSAMIAELTEMAQNDLEASFRNSAPRFVSNFRQIFIHLSEQCLDQILMITGGRHTSSFIIAFLVKNRLLESLVDLIPTPIVGFWTATDLINLDKDVKVAPSLRYKAIRQIYLLLDERYLPIFDYDKLAINITAKSFTCLVCFELASLDAAIACGDAEPFDDDIPEATDPCSSTDAKQIPVQHKFCTECIHRHAEAAAESMPLSECGTGLKCMEHGCKRPLLFSRIRNVLPKNITDLLESRVLAENLAAFGDIEKCPKCNFAVAMEAPKEVDKVFRCLQCKSNWCRLCELPWNDDHFGQTCDEAALKIGVQKKQRDLERMASEAVMRKCHKCNLVFTKDEGCNKITCRCRATQCYICRATDIDYTHFCGHPQIPSMPRTCCQKCLLWENATRVDQNAIVQVYQQAGEEPPKDIGPRKKRPRLAMVPIPGPR